jgi:hypothetical protein
MNTMTTKYFVVSLPRTGTKSLCKMVETLGIEYSHAPTVQFPRLLNDKSSKIRMFADTPVYSPSYVETLVHNENYKFIYIVRKVDEWKESFERVRLDKNYNELLSPSMKMNPYRILDRDSLKDVFNDVPYDTTTARDMFLAHAARMFDIIPKERLLVYQFSDGWEPLCEFLDVPIPQDVVVPHINKNTMFETI